MWYRKLKNEYFDPLTSYIEQEEGILTLLQMDFSDFIAEDINEAAVVCAVKRKNHKKGCRDAAGSEKAMIVLGQNVPLCGL